MATTVYPLVGSAPFGLFPDPIIAPRDPTTTDKVSPSGAPYRIFQGWNNNLTDSNFIYLGAGNWVTIASVVGSLNQLTGNSGIALPAAGNINIVGTGTLSFAGAGSTITGTITPGTGLVSTLTGNSGGAVSPTAGNINVLGNNALGVNITGAGSTLTVTGIQGTTTQVGVYEAATAVETQTGTDATRVVTPASLTPSLITPFVVGPNGAYTTVQSALTAANAAGGGTVFILPGSYTENLTLFDNCQIVGSLGFSDTGAGATITGVHTPPATGSFVFRNIRLLSATHIFSSAVAGSAHLVVADSFIGVTNGFLFNLPNWTGIFEMWDLNSSGGTSDGVVNNTGGASVFIFSAGTGAGTGQTMVTSGLFVGEDFSVACPVNMQTGTNVTVDLGIFNSPVTLSNNTTGTFRHAVFNGDASAAITMSSSGAVTIDQSTISSSNNPAIAGAGAGVLSLGGNTYTSNALLAGTLTVAYLSLEGALATTNTPGASPQIVNARVGQVAFTDVVANGAYGTLTMTNSKIAAGSKIIASASCTTVNSAIQVVEITPGAGSVAFRLFNAGAASTAANILINFWVMN